MDDAVCRYLDWDSEFFGVRVARFLASRLDAGSVQSALTWCKDNNIQCLYLLADSGDSETTKLAEDNGFRLVDIRTTMTKDMTNHGLRGDGSAGILVRGAVAEDIPQLRAIARTGHRDTRFYHDEHFPKHRCDALYETWIERSCSGYAGAVLVAELAGHPVGYITCHFDDETSGRIGLAGVHPDHQGLHVGRTLVTQAAALFAERGVRRVSVVTQGRNVRAQRLYQRCGFTTSAVELWYHRWFGSQ